MQKLAAAALLIAGINFFAIAVAWVAAHVLPDAADKSVQTESARWPEAVRR
jgi:hypothetical protein